MFDNNAVIEKAAELKTAGIPFTLVTVVRCESPTSAKPGAKAIVEADGAIQGWIGGGCAQPAVIKMSKQAIQDGQSRLIRISPTRTESSESGIVDFGTTCHSGGTLDIFIDPVVQRPTLLIIGASPVAQSLSALAHHAGFTVVAAFADISEKTFPDATHIIDNLQLTDFSTDTAPYVVVATQGKQDEASLEAALGTKAGYIAFVASDRKAAKLRQFLVENGHNVERIDSIVSPAGIDIGAITPEEIALSVLAGVIQARRINHDSVARTAGLPSKITDSPYVANATTLTTATTPSTSSCCGGTT